MKKILPLLFAIIYFNCFAQQATFLIPYRSGNKWGYCDTLGRVKINPQFTSVDFFNTYVIAINENHKQPYPIAKVHMGNSTLIIDSLGNKIISEGYESITAYYTSKDIFFSVTNSNYKTGLYKNNKQILAANYDGIDMIADNRFIIRNGSKQGMLKDNGEWVIPIQYDEISRSMKFSDVTKTVWLAKKGNAKTKVIDNTARISKYRESKVNDYEELGEQRRKVEEANKRNGKYTNPKSAMIFDTVTIADTAMLSADEKAAIALRDSIVALKPTLKSKFGLDSINELLDDGYFYYIEKNGKPGIIDDSLQLFLLEKKYNISDIIINDRNCWLYDEFKSLVLFIYEVNEKFGIINEFGDEILPPIYDELEDRSNEGYIISSKSEKQGIFTINTFYKPIPPKYDYINLDETLQVNEGWQFNLYKVTDKEANLIGYVGENGIEYFKNVTAPKNEQPATPKYNGKLKPLPKYKTIWRPAQH